MSDELPERQWNGEEDAIIAFGTDVWLRDSRGVDIDLDEVMRSGDFQLETCSCEDHRELVDGTFAPVNSAYGIEACDIAGVFESDFDAAVAIRDLIDPTATIWYHPSPKESTPQ